MCTSKQNPLQNQNSRNERKVITMKRSVKTAAVFCALIMAATSVSAVTAYADDTTQTSVTAQADAQKPKAKNIKVGKVTAVNGSEITLALSDFAKPEKPADNAAAADGTTTEKKEKPEKKQKVKTSDSTANTADNASDTAKTKPEDKRGGKQKRGKKGEFTENGTTLTITLTDSVSLKKGGKTVTAADIAIGDILELKYNDSDELVGIKVSGDKTEKSKPANGTKTKGTRKSKKASTEQTATA